jgi:hypothetical protein
MSENYNKSNSVIKWWAHLGFNEDPLSKTMEEEGKKYYESYYANGIEYPMPPISALVKKGGGVAGVGKIDAFNAVKDLFKSMKLEVWDDPTTDYSITYDLSDEPNMWPIHSYFSFVPSESKEKLKEKLMVLYNKIDPEHQKKFSDYTNVEYGIILEKVGAKTTIPATPTTDPGEELSRLKRQLNDLIEKTNILQFDLELVENEKTQIANDNAKYENTHIVVANVATFLDFLNTDQFNKKDTWENGTLYRIDSCLKKAMDQAGVDLSTTFPQMANKNLDAIGAKIRKYFKDEHRATINSNVISLTDMSLMGECCGDYMKSGTTSRFSCRYPPVY